jgi:hypothetical protein
MQLKLKHRRGREQKDQPVICWLILCNRLQRLDAQRSTVLPAHAAHARHCGRSGLGFGSTLRVDGD